MIRKKWTEDLIIFELTNICKSLGKFPSVSDLRTLNRNDLMCAVTKRGGFLFWAQKLGFKREISSSDVGWDGESKIKKILEEKGFDVESRTSVKCSYDLLISKVLRVEVKSTNYHEYGATKGWFYRLGKNIPSDFAILYQLDTTDCYIIPWTYTNTTNISITKDSKKYLAFKNRFDLLDNYIADYKLFLSKI